MKDLERADQLVGEGSSRKRLLRPINLNIARKMRDKAYRRAFAKGQARDDVAMQIRHLRETAGLSQAALARKCGMKQSAISRVESGNYTAWSYRTLQRVADALDVCVRINFERLP